MALGVYVTAVLIGSNTSNATAAAALQTAIHALASSTVNGQDPAVISAGMDILQGDTPAYNYWAIVNYLPNS